MFSSSRLCGFASHASGTIQRCHLSLRVLDLALDQVLDLALLYWNKQTTKWQMTRISKYSPCMWRPRPLVSAISLTKPRSFGINVGLTSCVCDEVTLVSLNWSFTSDILKTRKSVFCKCFRVTEGLILVTLSWLLKPMAREHLLRAVEH